MISIRKKIDAAKTLPKIKKPLIRVVTFHLFLHILLVVIGIFIVTYFYLISTMDDLVIEQLLKYTGERGIRESTLFLESNEYQLRFQKEYVERFERMGNADPVEWFEEHLEFCPEDGTYRSKPELFYGKDMPLGRYDQSASMMIGADTEITPEVRRALAVGYDMIAQYGPAWREPFVDLYFSSPEKTSVSRWPGTPWGLMMDDAVEWRDEEWFAVTTVSQNPERSQRWTGVLFDERNGNWMVSGVTPLDIEGKQVGMVGTDLLLGDITERTINDTFAGSMNILLQDDGRIIVHPELIDEIINSSGLLTVQNSSNEKLQRIFELVQTAVVFPQIIENKEDREYVAITKIQGPDWYFITIYPRSIIITKALKTIEFLTFFGIIALIMLYSAMSLVLKYKFVDPLKQFIHAVRNFKINHNQWKNQTADFLNESEELSKKQDELGLLASSFINMVKHLNATYTKMRQYKHIVSSSSDIMALVDKQFYYLTVNRAFYEAFAYDSEYLIGKTVKEIFGEDFFTHNCKPHADRCLAGEIVNYQFWYTFPSIGKCYMETTYYPYFSDNNEIMGFMVTCRNITERKKKDEERAVLEDQLRQAQKMEAVGTLAGGIAHDFNNILSVILGYADIAKEETSSGSTVDSALEKIMLAGNRAKDLVTQILTYSRQTEINRTPNHMQSLINETLKLLRSTIPTTITISHEIDPTCGVVLVDPTQIHQIVMNLCTNAASAMEDSGGILKIALKRYCTNESTPVTNFDAIEDEYVELVISDTGTGIDPEVIDRIFDPFFTTKEAGKGTGMGLAIIHGIISDYNGAITVESELGKGTTFHVYFPVVEQKSINMEEDTYIPARGTEHILFVDDEQSLLDINKNVLEQLGYTVSGYENSKEALSVFKKNPEKYDLVVTDQTMPEMTGYELAKKILKINPSIPIILCTGFSSQVDEEKAKALGIREFAQKPLSKNTITQLIRKVLDTSAG